MDFTLDGADDLGTASPLNDTYKIAIVGNPGDGKSWLMGTCATDAEKLFCFDFDGRKQSLKTLPIEKRRNIMVKTYQDVDFPNRMPTAWTSAMQDLQKLETLHKQGKLPFKWFGYDSSTFGSIAILNYIMYNTPSMRREIKAAGRVTYVPAGFDTYKAEQPEVLGFWQRLLCMGNLIVTFHIGMEKSDDSNLEKQKYTGKYGVVPPRYNDYLALFNDQWRIKAKGPNQYEVQTQPTFDFTAKNTLLLDATEKADIRVMMQKYMTKTSAASGK